MATIQKQLTVTLDSGQNIVISPADEYVMYHMLNKDHQRGYSAEEVHIVPAIKYIRMQHAVGLKEAKDIVELYRDMKD